MQLAQILYEQGRITYHRTDGLDIAAQAQDAARQVIEQEFGEAYLPDTPPIYGKGQAAHEAIRPVNIDDVPNKVFGNVAAI